MQLRLKIPVRVYQAPPRAHARRFRPRRKPTQDRMALACPCHGRSPQEYGVSFRYIAGRELPGVRACQVAYLSAARRLVSPLAPQKLCVGAMHASADIGPVIAGPAEALAPAPKLAMPPSSMKSGRRWSRSAR